MQSSQGIGYFPEEPRSPLIVRVWNPEKRTLKQPTYDGDVSKTFIMGHISFEYESQYHSVWQIEEKPVDSHRHFKDRSSIQDYKSIFSELIDHYQISSSKKHEEKESKFIQKMEPKEKLAYEIRLEGREPNVVICFHRYSRGVQFNFSAYEKSVDAYLRASEDGVPPERAWKRGWISLAKNLLVDRGLGEECCPYVAMYILSEGGDDFYKGELINPYRLAGDASFEDFNKMLGKMKRDEMDKHPSTKDKVYPGETALDSLPRDKQGCVIL